MRAFSQQSVHLGRCASTSTPCSENMVTCNVGRRGDVLEVLVFGCSLTAAAAQLVKLGGQSRKRWSGRRAVITCSCAPLLQLTDISFRHGLLVIAADTIHCPGSDQLALPSTQTNVCCTLASCP